MMMFKKTFYNAPKLIKINNHKINEKIKIKTIDNDVNNNINNDTKLPEIYNCNISKLFRINNFICYRLNNFKCSKSIINSIIFWTS